MSITAYRLARNPVFLTTLILLLSGFGKSIWAQSTSSAQEEFNKLADAYYAKQLSDKQYLERADSLTHQLFSEGQHFETKELVELLNLYEEIAWNQKEDNRPRINYFFLLFNNARMFKNRGASMYYAEKITEVYKEGGEENPLVAQLQKSRIYEELELFESIIEIYESERAYLTSLPQRILQGDIERFIGLNAMYILSPTITGYIELGDTVAAYETARLAKQIGTALQQIYPASSRRQMLYNELLMIDMDLSIANFEHQYDSARLLLNRMEALKTTYSDQATNFIDVNLIRRRIDNYLALGNPDSVRAYVMKYESSPAFGDRQRASLEEYRGRLQAIEGDHAGAYASVIDALELERYVQRALMKESSDLLYAFTQAEHSEISLMKAEKEKQQQTRWLVVISVVASFTVLTISLTMLQRSRKANKQIEALNNMADMQIISLQEIKHRAIRDEQQRLGQDLHDSLSSSIASVKHQLEIISLDTDNPGLKNRLTAVQDEVTTIYEAARNKSHEWFYSESVPNDQSFEQLIHALTDTALPDNRYKKNIHIDNGSLSERNMDIKITLLRVIQEAITNIIKHAKATAVDIFVYEETEILVLTVKDDGKGMGKAGTGRNSSKMGLQSIRRRVQSLNGKLTIDSDANGTEITASIPLHPVL